MAIATPHCGNRPQVLHRRPVQIHLRRSSHIFTARVSSTSHNSVAAAALDAAAPRRPSRPLPAVDAPKRIVPRILEFDLAENDFDCRVSALVVCAHRSSLTSGKLH
jgi:hypothetical protein